MSVSSFTPPAGYVMVRENSVLPSPGVHSPAPSVRVSPSLALAVAASSAACASSSRDSDEDFKDDNLPPPASHRPVRLFNADGSPMSKEAMAAITHLNAAMVSGGLAKILGGQKKKGKSKGNYYCKRFDPTGPRPGIRPPSLNQAIQVTMRGYRTSFLVSSTTVPTFSSASFILTAFSGFADYTTCFDQYRIDRIEAWVEVSTPRDPNSYPMMAMAVDIDDANTPTSIDQVAVKQGSMEGLGDSAFYFSWTPGVAIAAYSGVFTSFASAQGVWIDSGSTGVQHYGLKVAALAAAQARQYDMTFRAWVSFRNAGI